MGRRSSIFIISAPSGAGKSTLIQLLLAQNSNLFFSTSHTTRPAREGEINGNEYFFVSEPQFRRMMEAEEFLEWAEVHGYYYGTSKEMLTRAESEGRDLVLDIDVQGASKVKKMLTQATSIFILPPSFEVLHDRLQRRKKDTPDQIERRMENARQEIRFADDYDYIIINHELHTAFEDLSCIIRSQACRRENLAGEIEEILRSFTDAQKG